MQHLEDSGAIGHIYIYIYIYVIRRLKVKDLLITQFYLNFLLLGSKHRSLQPVPAHSVPIFYRTVTYRISS